MKRTTINVENSEGLPLSDAVRFGNLLFVSGMVGMDAAGKVVAGGIAAETRQTFRNIAAVLTAGGATFAAFPHWYATMFSGFYLPLFLLLVGLIIRGISFEYRSKDADPAWRNRFDWMIATGSFMVSLML